MNKLTIKEIASFIGADTIGMTSVTGVNVDTRFVKEGDLFVCLVGSKVDGHDFAQEAIDKGAKALMVSRKLDINVPQILVADTLKALFELARNYKRTLNMLTIAISGSNGKTSTKDMLQSVCELLGPTVSTYKNQNTEIGSCLTIFRCDSSTRYGIFEMGLETPGEIAKMTKIVNPEYAILTNLDQAHIEFYDNDMSQLAKEKFTLFDKIEDKEKCFYQGDMQEYRNLADGHQSFGFNENNDYVITDVVNETDYTKFKVNDRSYQVNLLGKHQASNAAGVVSLLRHIGFNDNIINKGLSNVKLTEMRTEIYNYKDALILFDAYKSSPQSLDLILELFADYKVDRHKIAVIADMYQLGLTSQERHIEALKKAKELKIDEFYFHGPEFEKALAEVNDDRFKFYKDKDDLKKVLQDKYLEENFIMFKGSRIFELESLLKED